LQALPDSLQAELVKATEGGQIGRGKGSVEHVEVFPVDSVGTSILEDLDPYPPIAARTPTTPSITKSLFFAGQRQFRKRSIMHVPGLDMKCSSLLHA
ncbi:hypothetical protein, partial [Microbacterium sp. GXF6406]